MLNCKDLNEILSQANTSGVLSTFLINQRGDMVTYVGDGDAVAKARGRVISSVWSGYEQKKPSNGPEILLNNMIISCDSGRIVVEKVADSGYLLCMFAKKIVNLGLLCAKAKAVVDFLREPLANMP